MQTCACSWPRLISAPHAIARHGSLWGRCFGEAKADKFAAWMRWNDRPMMLAVLSNPSDKDYDFIPNRSLDNVVQFAHEEGFGGVEIVNAFSAVAGTSSDLKRLPVRILRQNDEHISAAVAHAGAIFVAWGDGIMSRPGMAYRAQELRRLLGESVECFGMNAKQPRHAQRLPFVRQPYRWPAA